MDRLQVKGKQIVDAKGNPVRLRGTCIGGFLNMENFIDGFPGAESMLRDAMRLALGKEKSAFFFERFLDHFFNEYDIRFIKDCGANVIRIPLNYRHFEDDERPFVYKESGFNRLDKVVNWCQKHELYVILDLHAVQGWQNSHWHSDNRKGLSLLWHDAQYQERFIGLWRQFATHYRDNPAIAGYNLMNEPCVNTPNGDYPYNFYGNYRSDFETINRVYRATVEAIRKIDPHHLIFLEGDKYSVLFSGFEPPFADNLVYSSHNYTPAGFGPGPYPGVFEGPASQESWDRNRQLEVFQQSEGFQFTQKYQVPLWVGEFGSQFDGPWEEITDRLKAMDDQIGVFEEFGAHWTTWTYKDVGVMGWSMLDPESEYMRLIAPVQRHKKQLGAESFINRSHQTAAKLKLAELATLMEQELDGYPINHADNVTALSGITLQGYAAALLLPVYAGLFQGMSEERLDDILSSFEIKNCRVNQGLLSILEKYMKQPVK
ncbi:MAG TPA: glycoside hydrolase family 5 protein [Bacillota bacterium]|nr:glycoside hydrolase family 5 protein [Bacillota bacterium]